MPKSKKFYDIEGAYNLGIDRIKKLQDVRKALKWWEWNKRMKINSCIQAEIMTISPLERILMCKNQREKEKKC